jgi:hypothetical protein
VVRFVKAVQSIICSYNKVMTISCQEDKTEFLRLLETLYDAEYNGKPYVTLRDLGNDDLFDRQWVLSITGAYPDVVRSEEHRPPTGGRISTRISLACDYVEALGAVTKIQCDEDHRMETGTVHHHHHRKMISPRRCGNGAS